MQFIPECNENKELYDSIYIFIKETSIPWQKIGLSDAVAMIFSMPPVKISQLAFLKYTFTSI